MGCDHCNVQWNPQMLKIDGIVLKYECRVIACKVKYLIIVK